MALQSARRIFRRSITGSKQGRRNLVGPMGPRCLQPMLRFIWRCHSPSEHEVADLGAVCSAKCATADKGKRTVFWMVVWLHDSKGVQDAIGIWSWGSQLRVGECQTATRLISRTMRACMLSHLANGYLLSAKHALNPNHRRNELHLR